MAFPFGGSRLGDSDPRTALTYSEQGPPQQKSGIGAAVLIWPALSGRRNPPVQAESSDAFTGALVVSHLAVIQEKFKLLRGNG